MGSQCPALHRGLAKHSTTGGPARRQSPMSDIEDQRAVSPSVPDVRHRGPTGRHAVSPRCQTSRANGPARRQSPMSDIEDQRAGTPSVPDVRHRGPAGWHAVSPRCQTSGTSGLTRRQSPMSDIEDQRAGTPSVPDVGHRGPAGRHAVSPRCQTSRTGGLARWCSGSCRAWLRIAHCMATKGGRPRPLGPCLSLPLSPYPRLLPLVSQARFGPRLGRRGL